MTWLVKPCDKWGEVAVGTHPYGAPSLAGRDVAVGLGATDVTLVDTVTGEVVRTCERGFGPGVTVDSDPTAELRALARRPGAWRQSRVRSELPADVVSYLDGLGRRDLSDRIGMLGAACDLEGFDVAAESMLRLVRSGRDFTASDTRVLALRVVTGSDAPDAGPDPSEYDRALLGGGRREVAGADSDARLRACGRAVMLSNHTTSDVIANYGDADKGATMRTLSSGLAFREQNRRRRLLRRANLPVPKTLEGYDWSCVKLPPKPTREGLVACEFVRRGENLVLYGPVGTGEAHMPTAIGMAACSLDMRVRYFATTELVTMLSQARGGGDLPKLMRQLGRADLILLDGFGYAPVDRDGARLLLQAVDASCERRGLAIATNVDFSRWGTVLTDDQRAAAIIDRVAHHGQLVVLEGESYRLRHALMRTA